ncbi:MAG: efflux RND transporter permease subunit [Polyangiales bacterium]
MQWLAEVCVKRPVLATVLSLVILVVGSVFYKQLGVDQFPKIDFPIVMVVTRLPGASPEDVETDVTDKIEGAVNTISAIDELHSSSSEGVSQVMIQFKLEKSVAVAAQEVQEKVNGILSELPRDIEPPSVVRLDPDAMPVLFIAVNAKGRDVKSVTDYADRVVRRRIESVSGVGQVNILGGRERQINVWVDPNKMRGLGLTALEVARAIDAQNLTVPGGRVDTSRDFLTLRIHGRVQEVADVRRIVVKQDNGRVVRLDEVASVEDGVEELETSALWNGERTVILTVRKQSDTNTVAVVDAVRQRLDEVKAELPEGYTLEIQRDGSTVIRTGAEAVTEHLILGALFAGLVVLFFLGSVRSTVIAAVAIPTSIVGTFALMKMQGFTLNTITLLALALAVGIVIDDAIVVLENIFKHVEEEGKDPIRAAIDGTREIAMPVLATTLSLIAVFLPIAFVAGIPGRFLASFGITMAFSIAVSLFVSFTLTPMLASRWLRSHNPNEKKPFLQRIVDYGYRPMERGYVGLLGFCMRHRWIVVIACLATLYATGPLAMKARKGFLPIDDRAQFEVLVRLPEGRSVAATEVVGERVARQIREMKGVDATMLTIGDDEQRTPNLARIYVKLVAPDHRLLSQDAMKGKIREEILTKLPSELRTSVADVNEFGGGQSTARIQYILGGPDLKVLTRANEHILEKMRKSPLLVDVDSTLIVGKPELGAYIDRDRAATLGVQVADIAQTLQLLVGGQKVSSFAEAGEQYDVRLRASSQFRVTEDALRLLTVPSRTVGMVSLMDVVKLQPGTGPSIIRRYQRQRQVTFLANAAHGASEADGGEAIARLITEEKLPAAYRPIPVGQTKLMKETGQSFIFGLLGSMVFMYLILAAQFESWLHPVTILLSLPLTLPFAILSVILFDQALDIYSFLGIFVLFGVVKKNAILQIARTLQLREQGIPRLEAVLRANAERLRPILMTTFAFVAGMIPLVTAQGIGSGYNRATAGVVVGGQVMSLLLTLLAVPVAYSFFDDLGGLWGRLTRRRSAPATPHGPVPQPAPDAPPKAPSAAVN